MKTAGSGSISHRNGSADPDPWIHTKMSWIRNTDQTTGIEGCIMFTTPMKIADVSLLTDKELLLNTSVGQFNGKQLIGILSMGGGKRECPPYGWWRTRQTKESQIISICTLRGHQLTEAGIRRGKGGCLGGNESASMMGTQPKYLLKICD
jgi:hypothetical protein